MKKIYQILIIPAILFSLCINVNAENIYTEDALNYIIRDSEVIITKYFGTEEEVTIPQLINNMPVTVIASGAFVDTYAKRVYLPDSIAYIEPGAFSPNVIYSGKYEEKDPENPQEEKKEDDHRIDNNDGSIEDIPTIEVKEGTEEGDVDSNDNIISKNDNSSNTINKNITPTNPSSIERTYEISPILYVFIIVFALLLIYFIIRKVRKND